MRRTRSKTSALAPVSNAPLPSPPSPWSSLRLPRLLAAVRTAPHACADVAALLVRAGRITRYLPAGGPFTRMDSHVYADYLVPPSYDSLLGKVRAPPWLGR